MADGRCEMDPIQLFSARLVPVMHVRLRLNPQTSSASIFAKGNQVTNNPSALISTV